MGRKLKETTEEWLEELFSKADTTFLGLFRFTTQISDLGYAVEDSDTAKITEIANSCPNIKGLKNGEEIKNLILEKVK